MNLENYLISGNGWKAFTTKIIAFLSLFDTFGILYSVKY